MPVVDVLNREGKKILQTELADDIFNVSVRASILHEVVTMQLACKRTGTASAKHRSDIRGSGRKLFRQKGTGKARRGNIKAPLLRGGGVVFGPTPKSYSYKVPKKVRRLALKMALSNKLKEACLIVLNSFEFSRINTKDFQKILDTLGVHNALIITGEKDKFLSLSARNVPNIKLLSVEGLNVYDLLKFNVLILLNGAIKEIERRLLA
jgi:large subunit ribosomal protein L4